MVLIALQPTVPSLPNRSSASDKRLLPGMAGAMMSRRCPRLYRFLQHV
jgi:hypothetical protein